MNIIKNTTNPNTTIPKLTTELDNNPISVIYENLAFPVT